MSIQCVIGGHDVTNYVIQIDRTDRLCTPGQVYLIDIDRDCPYTLYPWDSLVLHESGTKVLTGFLASVSENLSEQQAITVEGIDTWKRALDWWTYEEYYTSENDTVLGLIASHLAVCGLSYSLESDISITAPAGMIIPIQPVSEILVKLASSAGLFYLIDADGVVHVNNVTDTMSNAPDIAEVTNLINVDLLESDAHSRNKIIVWGPTSRFVAYSAESWATVDHTMVYANPYIYDAYVVANNLLSNFHTLEEVVTCETTHDPSRRIGQRTSIESGIYSGTQISTTVKSRWNKSVGAQMTTIVGERCWGGAGPGPYTDGRDLIVATHECGVWRCRDIWQSIPHWEPLNIGLEEHVLYGEEEDDLGSSFDCNWFIRDPYKPNDTAFLLTDVGVFRTDNLEPGYEKWGKEVLNRDVGLLIGDTGDDEAYYIAKLKSTIAREGTYYVMVGHPAKIITAWGTFPGVWVGITNNRFRTLHLGESRYGNYLGKLNPPLSEGFCPPAHSGLWGNGANYGYQKSCTVTTWHRESAYLAKGNRGGLAAWHRNALGCTAVGLSSPAASNASPQKWHCVRGTHHSTYNPTESYPEEYWDDMLLPMLYFHGSYPPWPWFYVGSPLSPEVWGCFPISDGIIGDLPATSWLSDSTLHIPYDQTYRVTGVPSVIYYSPGWWDGDVFGVSAKAPTRGNVPLLLPWGTDPDLCHDTQGCIGTYTQDRNKVYCFSKGKPSRFAVSDDEGDTWTEKGSVSVRTSCFSGFPTSAQKVYAGRDPLLDPSSPHATDPNHTDDRVLIEVSWDRGETWVDVTGDLWTETQALGIRVCPDCEEPLGTVGLVTIAPRYC